MNIDTATKVLTGDIVNNLYTAAGTKTVILKDESLGKNNCNAVWLQKDVWDGCWGIHDAGTGTENVNTGVVTINLDASVANRPE